MQLNIEVLAKQVATPPPTGMKEHILQAIDAPTSPAKSLPKTKPFFSIGALLVACFLGILSVFFFNQKQQLQQQLTQLETAYTTLEKDCQTKEEVYAAQVQQWNIISDANTQQLFLNGNTKAPTLEVIAYWNESQQQAYLNILQLPPPPTGKCYQLWADVDQEMVSISILPAEAGQLVAIPFKAEAASLNITIEPAGGSTHATVANLVASSAI